MTDTTGPEFLVFGKPSPERFAVVLPYPPLKLGANKKPTRGQRARLTKAYRADCKIMTLKRFSNGSVYKITEAPLKGTIWIYPPNRIRRDLLNMATPLKPAIDGLFDALQLRAPEGIKPDDFQVKEWSLRWKQAVRKGAIFIELSPFEGGTT